MPNKISEYPRSQLISINDTQYGLNVLAPLPETISMGVGSEIGSPFASYATEGNSANLLALATDSSQKIGITTKKLFMGPDQPDLSLDLKFTAYYDATEEVLVPAIKLMMMAAGEERSLIDDLKKLAKPLQAFERAQTILVENITKAVGADFVPTSDLISYLRAPGLTIIKFGTFFTIKDNYISNTQVQFSNVLDNNGIPMEAIVSITITPQDPWTKNTLIGSFAREIADPEIGRVRGDIEDRTNRRR
jgi:hypothetical protein